MGDYPTVREAQESVTPQVPHIRETALVHYPAIREVPPGPRAGATPQAGDRTRQVPHHPRGTRDLEPGQVPPTGDRHGEARHHRQDGNQAPVTVPPPGALRPYARALLTLAIEVRAEGLALPGGRRSHGPIGKGGNRCVA